MGIFLKDINLKGKTAFVFTFNKVSIEDFLTFKKDSGKLVPALLTKISIFLSFEIKLFNFFLQSI